MVKKTAKKAILALSGGMDSTGLLALARPHFKDIMLVHFNYPSKHNQYETKAAEAVAKFYAMDLHKINLESLMCFTKSNLLMTGGAIPEGHYEDENMRQTVVPARNSLFIMTMAGIAESMGIGQILLGVHSGDHHIYPDCRPEFIDAINKTVKLQSNNKVEVRAPFINDDKTSIIRTGIVYGAPFHLTRTCYKDQPLSCGVCGSCTERLEAFHNNEMKDPVEYEQRETK